MPDYPTFFQRICRKSPYRYQERVADNLLSGASLVLRAPTGAGKTRAAIVPFLAGLAREEGAARLIYVLPMRTLAQGIHREADELMRAGRDQQLLEADLPEQLAHDRGDVRLQTGEAPGDPFFSEGRIVVATYDQLLSGLLHSPYSSSKRLHNINGAAIAGALVVFDEFHLMEIRRAFMTAVAFARWFKGLCQTVWMTATATTPVVDVLTRELGCAEVSLDEEEERCLPSVGTVDRQLDFRREALAAEEILAAHDKRSLVICNTVARAQEMAGALRSGTTQPVLLLHSRFFQRDRREREMRLRVRFGPGASEGGILVATQVVEAGLDLSCEHLWTELCPVNALVQRAGRCARFKDECGVVHVRDAPHALPYRQVDLDSAVRTLPVARSMTPETCRRWVEDAHFAMDDDAVRETTLTARLRRCRDVVRGQVYRTFEGGVSELIREADDSVFVLVRRAPPEGHLGWDRARVRRGTLIRALRNVGSLEDRAWSVVGWDKHGPKWEAIADPTHIGMVVCLAPDVCRYDEDGILLGAPGKRESEELPLPVRPGYRPLAMETWANHAKMVGSASLDRVKRDGLDRGMVARAIEQRWAVGGHDLRTAAYRAACLHDLGKLQEGWQRWAHDRQRKLGEACGPGEFLAHTDEGTVPDELHRPPHASASAVIADRIAEDITDVHPKLWDAMLVAIIGHHGGWIDDCEVQPVSGAAVGEVVKLLRRGKARALPRATSASRELDGLEIPEDDWPLASMLTRILRLSDQKATAEWSSECRR